MKRTFYIAMMVVWIGTVSNHVLNAQPTGTLMLSESFSDTIFPRPGWLADGVTRVTTSGSYVSAPAAASFGTFAGSLTLPVIGNPVLIRFQLGRTTTSTAKLMIVEVSSDGDQTGFVPLDTFDHDNTVAGTFTLCQTDLSAYSHLGTVWIRLRKASSTTSPWRVDDVEVYVTSSLPVTLVHFSATLDAPFGVNLCWRTASEEQNSHFNIERSTDGLQFLCIGRCEGAGTTSVTHHYRFTDANAPSPYAFYRLMQVDYDGHTTYSPILQVNTSGVDVDGLVIHTVSASNGLITIDLEQFTEDHLHLMIIGFGGQIHYTETQKISGRQIIGIKVKLSGGLYVLRVSNSLKRVTHKFSVDF
jgi:hypothetical protein